MYGIRGLLRRLIPERARALLFQLDLCQAGATPLGLLEVTDGDRETVQEEVPEPLGRDLPGHLRLIADAHASAPAWPRCWTRSARLPREGPGRGGRPNMPGSVRGVARRRGSIHLSLLFLCAMLKAWTVVDCSVRPKVFMAGGRYGDINRPA